MSTFASTGSASSPAAADEPADEWVKTGPDSVMDAESYEELEGLADAQPVEQSTGDGFFASVTLGDGFNVFSLRHYGDYTLRLVSGVGDIEGYRDEIQAAADTVNAYNGLSLQVAVGTVDPPANPNNFSPPIGEIWVMISDTSPCAVPGWADGALGCGGVSGSVVIEGVSRWTSGIVWLNPALPTEYPNCSKPVIGHEIGHALGLNHYDSVYTDGTQLMKSSISNCSAPPQVFRAGDLNGIRWGAEPTPSNDSKSAATASAVCPGGVSTVSVSTWFATAEPSEPSHAGFAPRRSVWFKYKPRPEQGTLTATISTGQEFNTVLAVYSGASPTTPVVSDYDSGPETGSQVSFAVDAALTYWIAVDGFNFARGAAVIDFDLPPIVDDLIPLCAPARLLDTRPDSTTIDGLHDGIGQIQANTTYQLPVAGRADIPGSADSVVLNVTAYQPTGYGFLTVFPCGVTPPTASNLNFFPGDVIPNAVVARVGSANSVCFRSSVATGLIVDVSAYFPLSDALVPLTEPARLLETRVGAEFNTIDDLHEGDGPITGGVEKELNIFGRDLDGDGSAGDVLDGAATVVLNVTAIHPLAGGYLTVYSCDAPTPTASNLNFVAGDVIPNMVIARVSGDGKVCFYSSQATELVVDVTGYFPNTTVLHTLSVPERMMDTRPPPPAAVGSTIDGQHLGAGFIAAGVTYELPIAGRGTVPADAVSVVLNVTAVRPGANGFITVFACGQDRPVASNLNFKTNEVIPNMVIARLGTAGKICIYTSQGTGLIVDVSGYFL